MGAEAIFSVNGSYSLCLSSAGLCQAFLPSLAQRLGQGEMESKQDRSLQTMAAGAAGVGPPVHPLALTEDGAVRNEGYSLGAASFARMSVAPPTSIPRARKARRAGGRIGATMRAARGRSGRGRLPASPASQSC